MQFPGVICWPGRTDRFLFGIVVAAEHILFFEREMTISIQEFGDLTDSV